MNPGENLVCPVGGMSMWITLHGKGNIGKWTALVDANFSTLDGRNTMADQITQAVKVHLQTISGAMNLQKEIGTKSYILSKLFGPKCLPRGRICLCIRVDRCKL